MCSCLYPAHGLAYTYDMSTVQLELVYHPGAKDAGLWLYEDHRLDAPHRGPFYVGIASARGRLNAVRRNKHHGNIARKHGIRREVYGFTCTWTELCQKEIDTIALRKAQGHALTNQTLGGDGTLGVATIINPQTGKRKQWPTDKPLSHGWITDAQRRFQDPEFRAKNKAAHQRLAQDPEWRAKIKAAAQRRAQDPEFRAKHKAAHQLRVHDKRAFVAATGYAGEFRRITRAMIDEWRATQAPQP